VSVVLAVDGGGSKTDAALVRDDGAVLGFARGPLSHPHIIGVKASADVIDALAGEVGATADLAMLLLAGLDFPDEEAAYEAEARERGWAGRVVVGNDTFAVLRAGSDRGWGVAVTCGHGINCVGVAPDGRRIRFPSLGEISGDWGGGGDIGRAAQWAAARSEDGRGPRTSLEQLVPAYFGLASPADLARHLHLGRISVRRLAELAPLTLAAAADDPVAAAIVDRQAAEVVAMAGAALRRLDLTEEAVDVVLGGGVLQSGNGRLLAAVEAGLREVGPRLLVHAPASPPIVGAALLGLDELAVGQEAHARVRSELGSLVASYAEAATEASSGSAT
jgi:N-acetylglucosamine kinase-like BadF-type ATPase